jgi:hypothetical protein
MPASINSNKKPNPQPFHIIKGWHFMRYINFRTKKLILLLEFVLISTIKTNFITFKKLEIFES